MLRDCSFFIGYVNDTYSLFIEINLSIYFAYGNITAEYLEIHIYISHLYKDHKNYLS